MTSSESRVVFVAIDGSQNADYAFEYYCKHIQWKNDRLVLFHFMDPVSISKDLKESLRELYDIKGNSRRYFVISPHLLDMQSFTCRT